MSIGQRTLGVTLTFLCLTGLTLAAKGPQTHNLGPSGLQGTIAKTTITITTVEKGSPADGKINKGDQIIGVGSEPFKNDVRRELAEAIDLAETEAAGGKLTLILKGNKPVDLKLVVLGSYSETAPYNCPKTDAIIKRRGGEREAVSRVVRGRGHPGLFVARTAIAAYDILDPGHAPVKGRRGATRPGVASPRGRRTPRG